MNTAQTTAHVLIVDDCPDAAMLLSEVVDETLPGRFTFDVGVDGREAVALALVRHPDKALLDIEMPWMDGLEAGAAIRSALDGMPLVMIAMSGSRACLNKAAASGVFDHVLAKPIDLDELMRLLE